MIKIPSSPRRLGHVWAFFAMCGIFGALGTAVFSAAVPKDMPSAEAAASAAGATEAGQIRAPMDARDMTNAPDHLYNLFLTWDLEATGTQVALFWTVQGDTLVAGATQSAGNFVPSVYAEGWGTLNLSVNQRLGEYVRLQLQAKNLTDPQIREVYRSEYIGDDVTRSAQSRGVDLAIGIGGELRF